MNYIQQPQTIEGESFHIIGDIISRDYPDYRFASPLHEAVIKRVIHTTADFDWLDILWFSADALPRLQSALRNGCTLYTDTTMALSGINKTRLAQSGCECRCFISDPRVVAAAKQQGITRSMAAVDLALTLPGKKLFVFGNAPTALFRLLEKDGKQKVLLVFRWVLWGRRSPNRRLSTVAVLAWPPGDVRAAVMWPPQL